MREACNSHTAATSLHGWADQAGQQMRLSEQNSLEPESEEMREACNSHTAATNLHGWADQARQQMYLSKQNSLEPESEEMHKAPNCATTAKATGMHRRSGQAGQQVRLPRQSPTMDGSSMRPGCSLKG